MDEADRRRFWIHKVNRAAIGHMNTKRDLFLVSDDPVTTGKVLIARNRLIYDCDFVSVNLLRSEKRPIAHSDLTPHFAMNGTETPQRFSLVMRNVDPRDS